jgi:putative flippase GtrA
MVFTPLSRSLSIFKKLFDKRIVRFLICGVISAAFNILLLAILIESFRLNQPVWRNLANFISIEISVLFSFVIYRLWVWSNHSWVLRRIFRREIPLYHLSCGASVATRSFILFPILDWMGINYTVNSLIGIAIGSGMNYLISDRVVFKKNS